MKRIWQLPASGSRGCGEAAAIEVSFVFEDIDAITTRVREALSARGCPPETQLQYVIGADQTYTVFDGHVWGASIAFTRRIAGRAVADPEQ